MNSIKVEILLGFFQDLVLFLGYSKSDWILQTLRSPKEENNDTVFRSLWFGNRAPCTRKRCTMAVFSTPLYRESCELTEHLELVTLVDASNLTWSVVFTRLTNISRFRFFEPFLLISYASIWTCKSVIQHHFNVILLISAAPKTEILNFLHNKFRNFEQLNQLRGSVPEILILIPQFNLKLKTFESLVK